MDVLKTYAFDLECFKNLFTATFVNVTDDSDKYVFYIGLGKGDYSDLLKFLNKEMTLVGYNNDSYDNPMLRFIMTYKGSDILPELYKLSGELISDVFKSDRRIIELRYPRKIKYPWKSVDLMRILAFDKLGISLKQTAINLKWHKIQDLPLAPDSSVNNSVLSLILDYNLNDTLITKRLYEEITPLRELRIELSKTYSTDLTSASDSRMANLILENIYSKEMHMDIQVLRDMRTRREKVFLRDCIAEFVHFDTPELKDMLDRISATVVYEYNKYKYSETIFFANCTFSLGIGGLHSDDAPGMFVTSNEYVIQDMDVASYYPNLIINNNFYPQHLGPNFIKVLSKITADRLDAKRSGNKVKAEGLKITVNSIFGKLGSEYFWLLDAKQMLSTTISGQLGLLMLIEKLHLAGIPIISCNTDGIVCKIPIDLQDKYYEVAKEWEGRTGMQLEFTRYKKYVRRDVNSYITEKDDGSTKEKGVFLKEVDLKKSYHMPIVAKCLHAYFIKGTPVKKTLEDCKDIMEFCISQKSGSNFSIELHSGKGIKQLQKTNRFYITKKGGALIKKEHFSKKTIGLHVGRLVGILNDFDASIPFEKYAVDIPFYEKEVMKIVDEIELKQIAMFDLSSLGNSTKNKMQTPNESQTPKEEKFTVFELNKLGKNQLSKKIESIANNNQIIERISPRYVYILDFNAKSMTANIYCLSKGIYQTIAVKRDAYKKAKLERGQLVFCNRFENKDGEYSIAEYKITDKIEEEKQRLDNF
jgi:hypothetical protein